MNTITQVLPSRSPARGIIWGGLIAGALDITAACLVYGGMFGAGPLHILQSVATGLLGPASYEGGYPTAALGLACHFFIAFSAATVYFAASRKMPFLIRNYLLSGVLYGIAVYFFMGRVVIPLSRARSAPFSVKMMLIGVTIHILCVGLPIATAIQRFSVRDESE